MTISERLLMGIKIARYCMYRTPKPKITPQPHFLLVLVASPQTSGIGNATVMTSRTIAEIDV
jgi:hypothetical protein